MATAYLDITAYQQEIESIIDKGGGHLRVLDLGCGEGEIHSDWKQYIERLSTDGDRYRNREEPVDVDIIGMDRERNTLSEVDNPVQYEITGRHPFPFADDSIDIVLSNKLMPHLDEEAGQEKYVKQECDRVLKGHGFQAHASYQTPR